MRLVASGEAGGDDEPSVTTRDQEQALLLYALFVDYEQLRPTVTLRTKCCGVRTPGLKVRRWRSNDQSTSLSATLLLTLVTWLYPVALTLSALSHPLTLAEARLGGRQAGEEKAATQGECLSRLLPRFKRLPVAPDGSRWLLMAAAHTNTRCLLTPDGS